MDLLPPTLSLLAAAPAEGSLGEALRHLVFGRWYMPHGHCYLWKPGLLWLHVVSDLLIGAAYVLIALVLWALVRRIRLPFTPMFLAFGLFIGACGLTHFVEVWNVWHSAYWLAGWVKGVTALASVATGVFLLRVRPQVVAVADAALLSEQRREELEQKNRELEALSARLRELDGLKTQFFANVSHELRTPLALILGPAERLQERAGAVGDEEVRRDAALIERNARTLLRHVNALLDAARLEAGEARPSYARVDVGDLVRLAAAHFDGLARERTLDYWLDLPGPLPAELDAEKVERVLLNLLGNAFKFTPAGGRVRVRVEALEGGARVRVAVEDSGPGIPADQREAVFERFRQVEGGATRRHGGTGLGLAIARDFARLHGGSLRAEEAPGGGARLVLELPTRAPAGTPVADAPALGREALEAEASVAAVATREAPPPEAAAAAGPEAPSVLVVEDTEELRTFVLQTLAPHFRVAGAADGEEGLRQAEALRPDVVVTDLMMPRASGEQLLAHLRAHPDLSHVPVLLLSARTDEAVRVRLLRAGAQDYVVKPFLAQELVARVGNLARTARARAALQAEVSAQGADLEALARELVLRKRQVQAALEAEEVARAQAQAQSAFKGTLLQLVSHELRTPVASMKLQLALLGRDRDAMPERAREQLGRLELGAARLQQLVETVAQYEEAERGGLSVAAAPVDVGALAAEVVEGLRPQAQRRLLALELARPADPVLLSTDARLVQLLLLNLVDNAVKFTERGRVDVGVRPFSGGRGDGGGVELTVRDTGRGIAAGERARILEPFTQGEAVRHKSTPGLGLGLALVSRAVQALGGVLEVESQVGLGSTFRVRLPHVRPGAAPRGA